MKFLMFGAFANVDMTEGRGPFRLVEPLYVTEADAWKFVNEQPGVMGMSGKRNHEELREKWPRFVGECPGWNCKICWPHGGDWQVRPLEVWVEDEVNTN